MAIESTPLRNTRQELQDGVRTIVTEFLSKCKLTSYIPYSPDAVIFEHECWAEAHRRGYDIVQLTKHLHVGILVSNAAYFYQSNEVKLYIAYFTALMLCVDDNYDLQSDGIIHFMERYQRGERHSTQVLNNIADLLAHTSSLFDPVATNLIMCSSFLFMNAMVIENITHGQKVSTSITLEILIFFMTLYHSYLQKPSDTLTIYVACPAFRKLIRYSSSVHQSILSSISRPFRNLRTSLTTSSRHIYISMISLITYFNSDITSFYKEELAGENENTVSLLAKVNNRTKMDQLRVLSDQVVKCHHDTCAILKDRKEAYGDYLLFWSGYVSFSAASKRYRLSELGI